MTQCLQTKNKSIRSTYKRPINYAHPSVRVEFDCSQRIPKVSVGKMMVLSTDDGKYSSGIHVEQWNTCSVNNCMLVEIFNSFVLLSNH